MNESSAYLWNEISSLNFFDENTLTDLLTEKYQVTTEIAFADSKKIMSEWMKAGIVEE